MRKFMNKLKLLKRKIREWTKDKRANTNNNKKILKEQLAESIALLDKVKYVIVETHNNRDENTKYYHGILNRQRNQLAIRGNRFGQPQSSRIQIDMDFPNHLSLEQQMDMESNITREKIKKAVWDCRTDKSLGPDGFTFGFYRRFWSVIEKDMMEAMNMFFQSDTFPKGCNASFIALITKTQDANMVKDFRPITLIGSLYKIIAKILANRLVLLSKWKMKTLSIGGRMTLIKSVLSSLPIYHMSIYKVPKKIVNSLESIRCHFFNGVDHLSKKPIWIKWKKVLAPIDKGGLGIPSFYALNRALLFKWIWRFYTQDSSLWAKVIKGIHGEDGKIGKVVSNLHSSTWLDIVKEIDSLNQQGMNFVGYIHKKMGNGLHTYFWDDI
ncbi:hypothetical protein Tco_1483699 [Tanacetum coccineum]